MTIVSIMIYSTGRRSSKPSTSTPYVHTYNIIIDMKYTLYICRSDRLPSLKPKRDLTLGGVPKVRSLDSQNFENIINILIHF